MIERTRSPSRAGSTVTGRAIGGGGVLGVVSADAVAKPPVWATLVESDLPRSFEQLPRRTAHVPAATIRRREFDIRDRLVGSAMNEDKDGTSQGSPKPTRQYGSITKDDPENRFVAWWPSDVLSL